MTSCRDTCHRHMRAKTPRAPRPRGKGELVSISNRHNNHSPANTGAMRAQWHTLTYERTYAGTKGTYVNGSENASTRSCTDPRSHRHARARPQTRAYTQTNTRERRHRHDIHLHRHTQPHKNSSTNARTDIDTGRQT